jgi:hypothetical protein
MPIARKLTLLLGALTLAIVVTAPKSSEASPCTDACRQQYNECRTACGGPTCTHRFCTLCMATCNEDYGQCLYFC